MLLLQHVPANSVAAILSFAAMAIVLALVSGGNVDAVLLRLVIQLPLLLLLGGIGVLLITGIAAVGGSIVAGSTVIAALIAALIAAGVAWAVTGGPHAFAGLGYHSLLRPAYAIAMAAPWLTGSNLTGLFRGHS